MRVASGRLTAWKSSRRPRQTAPISTDLDDMSWSLLAVVIRQLTVWRAAVPIAIESVRAAAAGAAGDIVVIVAPGDGIAATKPAAEIDIGAAL